MLTSIRRASGRITALSEKWKFRASRKPQIAKVVVVRPGVWTNTLMLCTLSSYAAAEERTSRVFMTMWISVAVVLFCSSANSQLKEC